MTKITYIPGEIANAAIDEHGNRKPVTRTQHIFDDAKGKSQSEVNADIDEEIAEIKGGSTDSIATLNQKIATEQGRAQGAEQGLNNRLSTVEELAEISVGGGDIGIGTAADFESDNPSDLAKVPTVGAMLGGANDGVYDISARHNGTKYADLAAALGTDGANVPDSLKRGGMSVKFVQSSDNNYVQYSFLLSGSFTAKQFVNTANWVKNTNSTDLTQSLSDLKSEIAENVTVFNRTLNLSQGQNHIYCVLENGYFYRFSVTSDGTASVSINTNTKNSYDASTVKSVGNLAVGTTSKVIDFTTDRDSTYLYIYTSGAISITMTIEKNILPKGAADVHLTSVQLPDWEPNTPYVKGNQRQNAGHYYRANKDIAAKSTFDTADGWTEISTFIAGGASLQTIHDDGKDYPIFNPCIKLVGMGTMSGGDSGVTKNGDIYYNTSSSCIYQVSNFVSPTSFSNTTIPYIDGAIYNFNDELYIWNGNDLISKTLSDNVPTIGSDKPIKSNGVALVNGHYIDNTEWLRVIVDSENKILFGIKSDGAVEWSIGIPSPIVEYIKNLFESYTANVTRKSAFDNDEEYEYIIVDTEGKIVFAIKSDGDITISKIPLLIEKYVTSVKNELLLVINKGQDIETTFPQILSNYTIPSGTEFMAKYINGSYAVSNIETLFNFYDESTPEGSLQHDANLAIISGYAYCVYLTNSGGTDAMNDLAQVKMKKVNLTDTSDNDTYPIAKKDDVFGDITMTSGAATPNIIAVGTVAHIFFQAMTNQGRCIVHTTFDTETSEFGTYNIITLTKGGVTGILNNETLINFFGKVFYSTQMGSTIGKDGDYYYAGVAIATSSNDGMAFIMKSTNLVDWTYVTTMDFGCGAIYEIACWCRNGYLYACKRLPWPTNINAGDNSMLSPLGKYNLATNKWVEAVAVKNCGTKPEFFEYAGYIHLMTFGPSRSNVQIIKIDDTELANSKVVAELKTGKLQYPSISVANSTLYAIGTENLFSSMPLITLDIYRYTEAQIDAKMLNIMTI